MNFMLFKKRQKLFQIKKSDKKEICVCCGQGTTYSKDEPISNRTGYIQGAGQLCLKCYKELYPKGDDSNG